MVSIIIALYNGAKYIEETLNAALAQTVDKEIIVIDDFSVDNSYELVDSIKNNNPSIILMKNEENMGFCKTVNRAVKSAKGEYVLVLGQDDILEKKHCEIMIKKITKEVSAVFCDYDLIDENGDVYDSERHCKHSNATVKDLYKENTIPSVGLIMNKEKLIEVGGYPENNDFPHYGEYHTWIRMALKGEFVFCDDVRAKYRRHKNNMTNSFSNKDIQVKLDRYFNTCKKQILTSDTVGVGDKAYVYMYMMYRRIRVHLFGR